MSYQRHELVLWGERAGTPYIVGVIDPLTGEVCDPTNPAAVAACYVACVEYEQATIAPLKAALIELANQHLDALNRAKATLELADGRTFEIAGETKAALDAAIAVVSAQDLRADLDVLVARGDLAAEAAADAVKVTTVTEYKADLRRVKALAARDDTVGQTVRENLVEREPGGPPVRPRRRPTIKRTA